MISSIESHNIVKYFVQKKNVVKYFSSTVSKITIDLKDNRIPEISKHFVILSLDSGQSTLATNNGET